MSTSKRCGGAIGLVFMALSAVSFSIMSLFVHILSTKEDIPSFEQIGFRSFTGILLCVLYILLCTESPQDVGTFYFGSSRSSPLLALRCVIGSIAMMCNWFIVTQLPLGDATVIVFTAPVFTIFVARVTLKEYMSVAQIICVMFSSIGVVLVARPSFLGFDNSDATDSSNSIKSNFSREVLIVIGLFGAFCSACTNVLVRKLTDMNGFVIVAWLMVSSLLLSAMSTFAFQDNASWPQLHVGVWVMIVAIGFLGFSGQIFKTYGLKWENAGVGSMMRNLDLVFAFIFQVTILHEKVYLLSAGGAALTLVSSLMMGVSKRWGTSTATAGAKYAAVQTIDTAEGEKAGVGWEQGRVTPTRIDDDNAGINMVPVSTSTSMTTTA